MGIACSNGKNILNSFFQLEEIVFIKKMDLSETF